MARIQMIIEPLSFNSKCISFPEWISLVTLCFAPLIAHVVSGTPRASYLTDRPPKWYDYMCIYSPTSIIWRYIAITDRRIRAIKWSCEDFAASNALFWTANGWDGEEYMGSTSAAYCLRYPEGTHATLFSWTTLKTLITTLQGVLALYTIIGALSGTLSPLDMNIGFGLDTLFFPLAILGLLRLCAATWLTEDFVYECYVRRRNSTWERSPLRSLRPDAGGREVDIHEPRRGLDPLLVSQFPPARFQSPRESWGSCAFRLCFLCLLWALWLLVMFGIAPMKGSARYSTTSFLLALFYFLFATVTAITYTFLLLRGKTTNTILPFISSIWYRLYNLLCIGLMTGLIVVACIETNKDVDGNYTSWKSDLDISCLGIEDYWKLRPGGWLLGLASSVKLPDGSLTRNQTGLPAVAANETDLPAPATFWLYNFTGYCAGRINDV